MTPPPVAGIDPVELELFTHRFEALAEQMGEMLRRTAMSVNVKERMDFSCALLDAEGYLVANAPHIPVHLGALGVCVRSVAATLALGPGDVAVTNHPAYGGSHLPDVTVIAPVHEREDGGERLGWVANRAHHAEIGGTRPGSMPPDARSLAEEGVALEPLRLVHGGEARWAEVEARLLGGRWPSRAPTENLADLAAALASVRLGARGLRELTTRHGAERVRLRMADLAAEAERRMRRALSRLPAGRRRGRQALDDGAPIEVTIDLGGGEATIDFTGSAPVHPGNLNATPAVVRSAVLYVLRLLLDEPLPLNEGIFRPVTLVLPEGMLAPPFPDDPAAAPAVVGGNVETSQRVVDTLIEALALAAGSQGTMNNTLFGTDRFGYYETVAGGAGAGPGFDGASAVHTHMTNTAITDPELLEHRYPVRLRRFAVRHGSGGAGCWRGGDGVVREIEFLETMELSLLTQHRREGPLGMAGGAPGAPGRQTLVRAGGTRETLSAIDGRSVGPGDRLILETPGGGGWGLPDGEAE
jgi:5-oxoprolinase (ATP-hydrolysing)